jgi:alternate signal-mediated exported protein
MALGRENMNKIVKGSVAGAAGITLLMGGYGTFALWSDDAAMNSGPITSGQLDIESVSVTWDDMSTTVAEKMETPPLLVPGDEFTMTQTFDITATGANIEGTLAFDPGTLAEGDFGSYLTHSVDVQTSSDLTAEGTGNDKWVFASPLGVQQAAVIATVTYSFSSDADNTTQNATATLSDGAFTLSQTLPTP